MTNYSQELELLIRSRYPLISIISWEEERVAKTLAFIAESWNKQFYIWTPQMV